MEHDFRKQRVVVGCDLAAGVDPGVNPRASDVIPLNTL
jgi:hypothetical protein